MAHIEIGIGSVTDRFDPPNAAILRLEEYGDALAGHPIEVDSGTHAGPVVSRWIPPISVHIIERTFVFGSSANLAAEIQLVVVGIEGVRWHCDDRQRSNKRELPSDSHRSHFPSVFSRFRCSPNFGIAQSSRFRKLLPKQSLLIQSARSSDPSSGGVRTTLRPSAVPSRSTPGRDSLEEPVAKERDGRPPFFVGGLRPSQFKSGMTESYPL